MKVFRRAFPVVAMAALTTIILPASAASHPSIATAAAATQSSTATASETADTGRVAFTVNDKTVLSVGIPQTGLGIEVQWSKHQCSSGFVSPPEVFSWAGEKCPLRRDLCWCLARSRRHPQSGTPRSANTS